MTFYDKSAKEIATMLNSDINFGLDNKAVDENIKKFGLNSLTKKKKNGFFKKLFSALKEPMLIILLFAFAVAFGADFGQYLKTGKADFSECFGILVAIILSVSITLVMERSSKKAFEKLNVMYDNLMVKVIRNGKLCVINQNEVAVGDVILIESGNKIIADGRIIEQTSLFVDESALTGESLAVAKSEEVIFAEKVPLAERKNCVFSGTFVTSGNAKMIVTAVGDNTEIGCIANELVKDVEDNSPLQIKLAKLGKTITIIGAICASLVFVISTIRVVLSGNFTFNSFQELLISCIVLIVAAVPEGLPTIVAVSLALNMIKLAKQNALIKKMTATETAGAVSVICSDKTGTLTQNKMSVVSVCVNEFCMSPEKVLKADLLQNFVCNSTADLIIKNRKRMEKGSATECALLEAYTKSNPKMPYEEYRKQYKVLDTQPFSSQTKIMTTTIIYNGEKRVLLKGAPEVVLKACRLTRAQESKLLADMESHQKLARRVICFAHADGDKSFVYDGYASIADPIRKDVYKAVKDCKRAGITVKILTGDNKVTAFAIAKELNLVDNESQVVNASDLEKLTDQALKNVISKIVVVARSTPTIKLRIVKALKERGEVVAVTGDGINDAPAIKHADVGIAMGKTGSEITKEAADIILLDDSFATVVKSISFGRNVFKNLQRFILFQLSVNISALLFITVCAILGLESPFNTLQLLWINVIMDGPPAITLGLETISDSLMNKKPIRKTDGIVNAKMLLRIIFNGVFVATVVLLQYLFNFLKVKPSEQSGTTLTLFILFQLFNAFNSRELGSQSIFKGLTKNKVMLITFLAVFLVHLFIVQVCYKAFDVNPLSILTWLKTFGTAFSIIVVSELYKLFYRLLITDLSFFKFTKKKRIKLKRYAHQ